MNGVSTIFSLTLSAIKGLHSHILPKWNYWSSLMVKGQAIGLWPHSINERQRSANDFWSSKYHDWKLIWLLKHITDEFAACIDRRYGDTVSAPFWKWASMEHQQFVALHPGLSKWQFVANYSYTKYWWPFQATQCKMSSLPHQENVCQWCVQDCWSCKSGN